MNLFVETREMVRDAARKLFKSTTMRKVAAHALFVVIMAGVLFSGFYRGEEQLRVGQISPKDIRSPVTRVVVDEQRTQELKQLAASRVQKVYKEDREARPRAQQDLEAFLTSVTQARSAAGLSASAREKELQALLTAVVQARELKGVDVAAVARYLVSASDEDLAEMSRHATSILGQLMESPVTEEALGGSFEQAAARSAGLGLAPEAEQFVWLAVVHSLRPNMVYDAEATQAAIDDAVSKVVPVQITIRQNQVIVRAGDPITAEHVSILEQLGVQSERGMAAPLAGILLFVLITTYLFIEYLRRYHHGVLADNRFMLLLGLAAVLVAVLAKVVTMISIGERPEINALSGYLIPAAVGPMLVAVLVEPRIGYLMAGVLAFYVGLLTQGNQLAFALTAFVGGSVGVFRMSQLSQTSDLARSGLHVALGNAATVVATGLLAGTMDAQQLGVGSLLGVLNGFLSTVLVIGLLPYLESAFSITSMIKLLELSNPNQELLRRLLVEAPGTYHHSILVGNLAEAAAQAVGAQPLLVRVGAYYHDIGKLKRPYFFVENQMSFENPHDKIAPSLSALIITSHIKDGVEMAHQARLPRVIVDFIEQHHGTSLVKYFYSRALEEDAERRVSEESFRYEGPKPQSKEAAIVMLADAVEAAVRSLAEPTPNKVEAMVRSIIRDKLNDRQLEECELTFRDLDVIAESFLKTLGGIYHTRVEYPENLAREFEDRRRKRGNSSAQSAE